MRLIIFLSFASLAACGQSQVKHPETHAEYFVCKKDKDCIVVEGVCRSSNAINKKFLQSYIEKTAEMAKSNLCLWPPPEIDWSKLSTDCFENKCRVIGIEAQLEAN